MSMLALTLAFLLPPCCKSHRFGHEGFGLRHETRQLSEIRTGSTSKHLYCKQSGGCSQCQEKEEIERYCADTGFKELLDCTTAESLKETYPVVLTYPYPPDVHIDDDRYEGSTPDGIRVVRSCTEKTVVAHQAALAAEMAAVEAASGALARMPLFKFELIMAGLLGLSLPVVYWRKIRIRHL